MGGFFNERLFNLIDWKLKNTLVFIEGSESSHTETEYLWGEIAFQ